MKDTEVADGTDNHRQYVFRKPLFVAKEQNGAVYGKLMHLVMQHIRYDHCTDLTSVVGELQRLLDGGVITADECNLVSAEQIFAFFTTEIGRRFVDANNVLREFKFSVLDDGRAYADNLENEKVLLQGVVDCALVEEDGITVIDFKTDYVTEDTVYEVFNQYKTQVKTYARALERIYELPVKNAYVYFFRLNEFFSV